MSGGLGKATRSGTASRVDGAADIGGGGQIRIGADFLLVSHPVRSHMLADRGASITIGDGVRIGYGAAIAAQQAIDIGDHTTLGPFVVIMDNDFHKVGDRHAAGAVAPVRIGSNVSIGTRVTILRGSTIGDNARVLSGSMVSGVVPANTTVSGVPARVVQAMDAAAGGRLTGMAELVQQVLGLAARPDPEDGPAQIGAWDSLGSLRLLLAIEETFGVNIREEEMQAAHTVAALSAIVERKAGGATRPAADIADLVQGVLGLRERPRPDEGPAQIAEWDSLGTLRLLLAIEEAFGVSISESEMRAGSTVAALSGIVAAKLGGATDRASPA
jgi:acetyltransferase-like isoleucine patch superfamily enzyme/acyl carrier protein